MIVPKPLEPGDVISVIAPSGPYDPVLFESGIERLRTRYTVELGASLRGIGSAAQSELLSQHGAPGSPPGFLAAPDDVRLRDLNLALTDPRVRAVVAARGGYGLTRIAHLVDWPLLAHLPRWLVGFSDATVLHLEALRVGVASWHAENVTGLGGGSDAAFEQWCAALEGRAPSTFSGLTPHHPGTAEGVLVGGNLSLITFHALSGRVHLPAGCVLALEDVDEAPYRLDRMLTALVHSRLFDSVSGFALGEFTNCGPDRYQTTALDVLLERLEPYGVPIVSGLPIGHAAPNRPLPLGRLARLDASAGLLEVVSER